MESIFINLENSKTSDPHWLLLNVPNFYSVNRNLDQLLILLHVTNYNVGSYLTELLNPLTQNEFIIRDSFDAANKVKSIPPEVLDDGYIFVSFDVESLFTNVPLQRTINIILDCVYNNKLVATQLKKRTLKKLIKDTCSKTIFSSKKLMVLVWVAPLVHFLQTLL